MSNKREPCALQEKRNLQKRKHKQNKKLGIQIYRTDPVYFAIQLIEDEKLITRVVKEKLIELGEYTESELAGKRMTDYIKKRVYKERKKRGIQDNKVLIKNQALDQEEMKFEFQLEIPGDIQNPEFNPYYFSVQVTTEDPQLAPNYLVSHDPTYSQYHGSNQTLLSRIYHFISSQTEIIIGVKELINEKGGITTRHQAKYLKSEEFIAGTLNVDTSKSQLTYGEITQKSMDKILDKLCQMSFLFREKGIQVLDSETYNLGQNSRFLDIGSGFGKPVFHTAFRVGCQALGVEILQIRVQKSLQIKDSIKQDKVLNQGNWVDKVSFFCNNAVNIERFQIQGMDCTHIYSYNLVMGKEECRQIASILNQTDFKVLVWSMNEKQTLEFGLNVFYIDKITAKTTGKQRFSFYMFGKMPNHGRSQPEFIENSLYQFPSLSLD